MNDLIPANKERYIQFLQASIEEIDSIDKATPWSELEPGWWLDMIDLRKELMIRRNKMKE